MDGFRNPGKDSLPYPKNHTEVAAAVALRAASAEIIQVQRALGSDADLHLVGGVLRDIAEGRNLGDVTTLADSSIVEVIRANTGAADE